MTDLNRPILGEPNAPCRSCGAPLAADQRYCLQCGTRRAEARLPFLDLLAGQPAAAGGPALATAATTTVEPSRGAAGVLGRMSANATLVAFIGCLLLALGVGVLIGGLSDGGTSSAAPPAQVITVGGAVPAAASSAAPSTNADSTATDTTNGDKKSSKGKSDANTASSAKDSHATNKALQDLDSTKGGDYAKKSAKLPKTVGTGGKAPPVDKSKPIGGGSDVESIG